MTKLKTLARFRKDPELPLHRRASEIQAQETPEAFGTKIDRETIEVLKKHSTTRN